MAAEPTWPEQRRAACNILATVFAAELQPETADALRNGEHEALLPAAAGDPAAAAALHTMRAVLAEADMSLSMLAAVYAGLFLGAGLPRTAPPFASAYLSESGRLYAEPARAMVRLLREADLDVADRGEAPDHLAVQLALLGELFGRDGPEVAAARGELRNRWMLSWLPAFAADVRRSDRTGFYAAAADLALWLLQKDADA